MGWFTKLIYGVDLDEEQKRSDQLTADLQRLNQDRLERGLWTQEEYEEAMERLEEADQQGGMTDVTGAVQEEFNKGLEILPNAVDKTLATTVGLFFKAIPLSVWIIGAVALFFWAGGWVWLKGRLARS